MFELKFESSHVVSKNIHLPSVKWWSLVKVKIMIIVMAMVMVIFIFMVIWSYSWSLSLSWWWYSCCCYFWYCVGVGHDMCWCWWHHQCPIVSSKDYLLTVYWSVKAPGPRSAFHFYSWNRCCYWIVRLLQQLSCYCNIS